MRIDRLQTTLTNRYKTIISKASQIVNIARASSDEGDVSRDITSSINTCLNDIGDVVKMLEQLADALEED